MKKFIILIFLIIFSFNSCAKKSSKSSTQTQTYTLVVVTNPQNGGSVVLNPSGGTYNAGTVVTIVATASAGYTFSGWSGDLTGTTNPATITMDSNKTVVANFTQTTGSGSYTLSINVSPQGAGTVSLNPSGGTYTAGTQVTLTAVANSGYVFSSWSGDLTGTTNPTTIIMDSNKSVTANFVQQGQTTTYTLTINILPQGAGTVSFNPSGGVYAAGTQVTLTATANSGYQFSYWSGDALGNNSTVVVTMDSNKTVTANFTSTGGGGGTTYTLLVSIEPSGAGTVSLNPSGGVYTAGTEVQLRALPNSGYQFDGWSGSLTGTQNPATIIMNSNKIVTANFSQIQQQTYTLTTSVNPAGAGIISLNPSGGTYTAGTQVTLTAVANSGYVFSSWSGDLTGTTNPATITMNSNKSVTANFNQQQQTTYTLTVTVSPTGAGAVSLNPAGGTYAAGTQVTLTATANTGYTFSSWSGDLTGTTNPATITMDSNKSVTANFNQQQQTTYTLTTSVNPAGAGIISLNPSGGTYTAGTVVVLTAQANSGYQFLNWTGDVTGTSNPTTVTMNANKSVTANFEQIGSDTARYSFETGVQGWVIQTYTDSQAITQVAQDTTKARYGSASLRCTVNLIGGHANYSKGETFIDMQTATNMSNVTVSVWVWVPSQAVGDPNAPNGIQIFFKDSAWKSKYSSWHSIGGGVVVPEQWCRITVNTATEQWGWDDGCNLSQVRLIGVKIGTGGGSTATFSGYIWIDSVNW